jgi:hypothetical protein
VSCLKHQLQDVYTSNWAETSRRRDYFNWSVWENNPIVSWTLNGTLFKVTLKQPPVAIAHISRSSMIAVVGNIEEFGTANLLFYSYDGSLKKSFSEPALGDDAGFSGVSENGEFIEVIVNFESDSIWKEKRGRLNLSDGKVTDLHRYY